MAGSLRMPYEAAETHGEEQVAMRRELKQVAMRDTYFDLVRQFPLVSIRSAKQLREASEFLDRVMARGDLDAGDEAYIDALSDLIEVYEDEHVIIDPPSEGSLLAFLMDQKGINQAELCRKTGISKSIISEVLSGKRALSKGNIQRLAGYFRVNSSLFL
jgi:HTH-type transcriptional regulator / antitoxin HigA